MPSSYDKINESFLKSNEWKDANVHFREMLKVAGLDRYEFSRAHDYNTNTPTIETAYVLKFGEVEVTRSAEAFKDFRFPSGDALTDDELNRIPELLFGKRGYPTYFCKKDKVLKKWPEFARKRLVDANMADVAAFEQRVVAQFQAVQTGEDLARDKKRFYERGVIDEIRKVVLKYYEKVGPEVIKEALDEVVAHAIMES